MYELAARLREVATRLEAGERLGADELDDLMVLLRGARASAVEREEVARVE